MKKSFYLIAGTAALLVLSACNQTTSDDSSLVEDSTIDFSTDSSDYTSVTSDSTNSTKDTKSAVEVWNLAVNTDYSNSTALNFESNRGELSSSVVEYNYQGYNIIDDYYFADVYGYHEFLYYHDYLGESHLYFEDDGNGEAWLKLGYHDAPLGIENTYFDLDTFISAIKKVPLNELLYADIGGGSYVYAIETLSVLDAIGEEAFSYNSYGIDRIEFLQFTVNSNNEFSYITGFTNDATDTTFVRVQVSNVGVTTFTDENLPAKPDENNVRTYADYKDQEPWVEKRVTSITLDKFNSEDSLTIGGDETLLLVSSYLPADANTKLFNLVSTDESIVTINHDFTSGQYKVFGVHSGTADVYLVDQYTNVESNRITVTVAGPATPTQTDIAHSVRFDAIDTNGVLEYRDVINNEKEVLVKVPDIETIDVRSHGRNSNLEITLADENLLFFEPAAAWNHMEANLDLQAIDHDVSGISFLYGLEFPAHATNASYIEARTYVSDDGETWTLAEDWTDEVRANISANNMKLYELEFAAPTRFVRVTFDSTSVGKQHWVVTQEINLYTNELCVSENPVKSIELTAPASIKTDDVFNVSAVVSPADADNKEITWSVGDASILNVSNQATGEFTALKDGTTTITATNTASGVSQSITVVIAENIIPVTSVSLSESSLNLEEGEQANLEVTVLPIDATNKTISYSSDDTSVATFVNGVVTAISEGSTTVKATSNNGIVASTSVAVTAKPLVSSISLTLSAEKIQIGKSVTPTVEITALSSQYNKYDLIISNENIAGFDSNSAGDEIIVGLKPGTVTVTARSKTDSTLESVKTLVVYPTKADNALFERTYDEMIPTSFGTDENGDQYTAGSVRFATETNGGKLMYVSKNGQAEAEYYCTSYDSYDNEATFKSLDGDDVVDVFGDNTEMTINLSGTNSNGTWSLYCQKSVPLTKIEVKANKTSIKVGETFTVTASAYPLNTTESLSFAWTNNATNIAVSTETLAGKSSYTFEGLTAGTASITVILNGLYSQTVTVVVEEVQSVAFPSEWVGTWVNDEGDEIEIDADGTITVIADNTNGILESAVFTLQNFDGTYAYYIDDMTESEWTLSLYNGGLDLECDWLSITGLVK